MTNYMDKYEVGHTLGYGGFGQVVYATRKADQHPVAIKFVLLRNVHTFHKV
jgi:serine/threonine protein kinase